MYNPAVLQGMALDPDNLFSYNFILQHGDEKFDKSSAALESQRLVKYFLAALTIPEDHQWVNLSPYENNRIIADDFGKTEMGRDLLVQDYYLKLYAASLLSPENSFGQSFWIKMYEQAYEKYGTTDIPVDVLNKVWIMPSQVVIEENKTTAVITDASLRVMLESDYKAGKNNVRLADAGFEDSAAVSNDILRKLIVPAIEREVNSGQLFAGLRKVYYSMALAVWYKRKVKDGIIFREYIDRGKTKGLQLKDEKELKKVYKEYLGAFKQGVFNFVKEEYDPYSQEFLPRKHFAGGFDSSRQLWDAAMVFRQVLFDSQGADSLAGNLSVVGVALDRIVHYGGSGLSSRNVNVDSDILVDPVQGWHIEGQGLNVLEVVRRVSGSKSSESGTMVVANKDREQKSLQFEWSYHGREMDKIRVEIKWIFNGRQFFDAVFYYDPDLDIIDSVLIGNAQLSMLQLNGVYRVLFQEISRDIKIVKTTISNESTLKAIEKGTVSRDSPLVLPFATSLFNVTKIAKARGGMDHWVTLRAGGEDNLYHSYRLSSFGNEFQEEAYSLFLKAMEVEKAWWLNQDISVLETTDDALGQGIKDRLSLINISREEVLGSRKLYPGKNEIHLLVDSFVMLREKVVPLAHFTKPNAERMMIFLSVLESQIDRLKSIEWEIDNSQVGGIDLNSEALDLKIRVVFNEGVKLDIDTVQRKDEVFEGLFPRITGVCPMEGISSITKFGVSALKP